MDKPSINEIARSTSHILTEFGNRGYSGTVDFYKDEIDVKGDGTLWATVEYEVEYTWTHEPDNRVTPSVSDYDVTGVRVKDANFFTRDGEMVEIDPGQANRILVNYFQVHGLDEDDALADQIYEQASGANYDPY